MLIECSYCKKDIKQKRIRKNYKNHFCNRICFNLFYSKDPNAKCLICGKNFKTHGSRNENYCSRECYFLSREGQKPPNFAIFIKKSLENTKNRDYRGRNNPCWRGGITSIWQLIRGLPENKKWRVSVFERDNYTCQKCSDNKGNNLNAHHIKPFQIILQEFIQQYSQFSPIEDKETLLRLAITYKPFWDLNNGITFCNKCHKHNGVKSVDENINHHNLCNSF